MFGHTDDQQQTDNNFAQGQAATGAVYPDDQTSNDSTTSDDSSTQNPIVSPISEIPNASEPLLSADNSSPFSQPTTPITAPAPVVSDDSNTVAPSAPVTSDENDDDKSSTTDHSELLDIKQQALQQLSPLVSHLDQTPEDKFKTTMMMIQASDDHALLPEAYKAAQAITDEKAKAQALLDVVNEINYFTQS